MTSALMRKELRECAGLCALALAALAWLAASSIGLSPFNMLFTPMRQGTGSVPFLYDSLGIYFAMAYGALALALGFRQSLGDQFGNAHLFLLHRPVPRQTIYLTKLAVGLSLYFLLAALPIAVYSLWAATEGTHASPFAWSMTTTYWMVWFSAHLIYLGAFLSGIRPGNWVGTKLTPLVAACAVVGLVAPIPAVIGLLITIVASAVFVAAILYTVETRDFA